MALHIPVVITLAIIAKLFAVQWFNLEVYREAKRKSLNKQETIDLIDKKIEEARQQIDKGENIETYQEVIKNLQVLRVKLAISKDEESAAVIREYLRELYEGSIATKDRLARFAKAGIDSFDSFLDRLDHMLDSLLGKNEDK